MSKLGEWKKEDFNLKVKGQLCVIGSKQWECRRAVRSQNQIKLIMNRHFF